jgi:type II secretory pathway predicted ATPase ExeA
MIKSTFGITQVPFYRNDTTLLPQQLRIVEIIRIHAQQGGFSVVVGAPGLGKTVIRQYLESLGAERDTTVVSFSRTLHTYTQILSQMAESFKLSAPANHLEKEIIQAAFTQVRERKTFYTLIDEAHLLDMQVLRKLRLLFEQFPKNHNLVLFGQHDLLYFLSMTVNQDIKSRITYSQKLLPLADPEMLDFIAAELTAVKLGANAFDESALELILRSVQGNLRLCRNLCYCSLVEACRDAKRIVSPSHVNAILIQPHWRSHEDLIKQQVA